MYLKITFKLKDMLNADKNLFEKLFSIFYEKNTLQSSVLISIIHVEKKNNLYSNQYDKKKNKNKLTVGGLNNSH